MVYFCGIRWDSLSLQRYEGNVDRGYAALAMRLVDVVESSCRFSGHAALSAGS